MLASEPNSASCESQLRICWMRAAPGMPSVVGVAPTSPSTRKRARSTGTSFAQRTFRCALEIRASSDPIREGFLGNRSRTPLLDARTYDVRRLLALTVLVLASPIAVAATVTGLGDPSSSPSAAAIAEIPATLLAVYESAAVTCPGLPWQVLAGIGWVESHHAQGHADPATGEVTPPIVGPPLDGTSNRALIRDATQPDGYAHALGPMQFLSTTWSAWATVAPDRPPAALPDVQNAWDAIYTAARYLCGGRDHLEDVRAAVLSYNHSEQYLADVLA